MEDNKKNEPMTAEKLDDEALENAAGGARARMEFFTQKLNEHARMRRMERTAKEAGTQPGAEGSTCCDQCKAEMEQQP